MRREWTSGKGSPRHRRHHAQGPMIRWASACDVESVHDVRGEDRMAESELYRKGQALRREKE